MKSLRVSRGAEKELDEAFRFYESRRAGLGWEFREEIEHSTERILQSPDDFAIYEPPDIRECFVHRFPYVIFFADQSEEILILAVAHSSRSPGYWKRRLGN